MTVCKSDLREAPIYPKVAGNGNENQKAVTGETDGETECLSMVLGIIESTHVA